MREWISTSALSVVLLLPALPVSAGIFVGDTGWPADLEWFGGIPGSLTSVREMATRERDRVLESDVVFLGVVVDTQGYATPRWKWGIGTIVAFDVLDCVKGSCDADTVCVCFPGSPQDRRIALPYRAPPVGTVCVCCGPLSESEPCLLEWPIVDFEVEDGVLPDKRITVGEFLSTIRHLLSEACGDAAGSAASPQGAERAPN